MTCPCGRPAGPAPASGPTRRVSGESPVAGTSVPDPSGLVSGRSLSMGRDGERSQPRWGRPGVGARHAVPLRPRCVRAEMTSPARLPRSDPARWSSSSGIPIANGSVSPCLLRPRNVGLFSSVLPLGYSLLTRGLASGRARLVSADEPAAVFVHDCGQCVLAGGKPALPAASAGLPRRTHDTLPSSSHSPPLSPTHLVTIQDAPRHAAWRGHVPAAGRCITGPWGRREQSRSIGAWKN